MNENNWKITIELSRETALILKNLKKEVETLYGEKVSSTDDLILLLANYYYKK